MLCAFVPAPATARQTRQLAGDAKRRGGWACSAPSSPTLRPLDKTAMTPETPNDSGIAHALRLRPRPCDRATNPPTRRRRQASGGLGLLCALVTNPAPARQNRQDAGDAK